MLLRRLAEGANHARHASVYIVVLQLKSPTLVLKRIAARVSQGGHDDSKAAVLRQFVRGWGNFEKLYQPLADSWTLYENRHQRPYCWSKVHEEGKRLEDGAVGDRGGSGIAQCRQSGTQDSAHARNADLYRARRKDHCPEAVTCLTALLTHDSVPGRVMATAWAGSLELDVHKPKLNDMQNVLGKLSSIG
jgi:hypothetical protein